MIEYFRRMAHSTGAKVFFGLLALCFVFLWGGNDAFQMISLSKDYTVAKVAGHKITTQQINLELQREIIRLSQQMGKKFTDEELQQMGLERRVLENLINRQIIELESQSLGLTVSDAYAAKLIKKIPLFHTEDGRFTKGRFDDIISRMGYRNEAEFVRDLKDQLLQERVLKSLAGSMTLPAGYVDDLYAWNFQVRTIQAVVMRASNVKSKTPTENDLRDFYAKNKKMFLKPETRSFKALVLDHSKYTKDINVQAQEVQEIYSLEKEKTYKGLEQAAALAKIKEGLLQSKLEEKMAEVAKTLEGDYDSGKSFETIAQAMGALVKPFKDVALVDQSKNQNPGDQHLVKLAFDQEEGNLSFRETSKDGTQSYYILVDNISPAKELPFQEAIDQVRKAYFEFTEFQNIQSLGEGYVKSINQEGKSFNTIFGGRDVIEFKINRQGLIGKPVNGITPLPLTLQAMFALQPSKAMLLPAMDEANPGKITFIVVTVKSVDNADARKAKPEEMESFKKNVEAQFATDLAEQYMTTLRDKYKVDINPKFFKE